MVKCLTQEHNMLVTAGFEPATFGLRVNSYPIPVSTTYATHAQFTGSRLGIPYLCQRCKRQRSDWPSSIEDSTS